MIQRDFIFNISLSDIFLALERFMMFSKRFESIEWSQFDLHKHENFAIIRNFTPLDPIITQRKQIMIQQNRRKYKKVELAPFLSNQIQAKRCQLNITRSLIK